MRLKSGQNPSDALNRFHFEPKNYCNSSIQTLLWTRRIPKSIVSKKVICESQLRNLTAYTFMTINHEAKNNRGFYEKYIATKTRRDFILIPYQHKCFDIAFFNVKGMPDIGEAC